MVKVKTCIKCSQPIKYTDKDCWFDYKGMDYDAKLVRCPECGAINPVKYYEYFGRYEWYET